MEDTTSSIQAPTWITKDNSPPLHHPYYKSLLHKYITMKHICQCLPVLLCFSILLCFRPASVHSYLNPLNVSFHMLFLYFSHALGFLCFLLFLLAGFNILHIFITTFFWSFFHSQRYLPFLPSLLSLHTPLISDYIMSLFIELLFSIQSLQLIKYKTVPHDLQSNNNPFSHCYVSLYIHTLFITVRTPKLSSSMDSIHISK